MSHHPFHRRDHTAFIVTTLLLFAALPAFLIGVVAVDNASREKTEANLSSINLLSRKLVGLVKPDTVKGVYLTSNTAGSDVRRGDIFDLIERTELNAAVIDIKTSHGLVAFTTNVALARDAGIIAERPYDLKQILADAHDRGIWTIARLPAFEDPALAVARPDLALTTSGGGIWQTRRGVAWLDPTNRAVWKYAADLAQNAIARGFDEVQFDYIRFPSDGALADTVYDAWSEDSGVPKHEVIGEFFAYVRSRLPGAKLSADLFGLTMDAAASPENSLFIGQRLRDAIAQFDVISPMVYPSHYPPFYQGFQNPSSDPGGVIAQTMDAALPYLETLPQSEVAGSFAKIRPWLQDFDLGAVYTPAMVRAQIDAVEARGAEGWLLWNPQNTYSEAALRAVR